MYLRLHLRLFAWITSIAYRVAVSTISRCRNQVQAHQKRINAPTTITAIIPIANLAKSSSMCYSPFGGPGRIRTAVQHAFALKELQQY